MSPSCSSILPRALSLWQHGLGRPHPPLLSPPPPPHCWIVCLSSYPPSTPTPCCMQQIGTPAAPNAAQLFHQAVTQAQPLWLTVFITAAGVTLESIWHSVCACTCVCACACVCVRMCVCVRCRYSRWSHYSGDLFGCPWIPHVSSQPARSIWELSSLSSLFKTNHRVSPCTFAK